MTNDLILEESTHRYFLEKGCKRILGVTESFSFLDERRKDPWYLFRGKFVHKATALHDRNELDESTIAPEIQGFLDAYLKFRRETDFRPDPNGIELSLYHPRYLYAGTLDRYGSLNGSLVIIDLKSGAPAKVDQLQAVAYRELCQSNNLPVNKQFDLYLRENGTYKLEPVENPKALLQVFLACLTVTRWKEGI